MTEDKNKDIYDFLIIGGGSAGLSAALYAGRYKLKTAVFTDTFGGTMAEAHRIVNYPGLKEVTGTEITQIFMDQVKDQGIEIKFEKVKDIKKQEDNTFLLETDSKTYQTKKLLLGIGKKRRKLGLTRENELSGKGVSYCATCDGGFYKDKVVGVIGGSDAAVTAALLLDNIASKVYIIYRKDKLRAEPAWIESVKKSDKIEIIYNTNVTKLLGEDKLESVELNNGESNLKLDGLFIEIGSVPNFEILDKVKVDLDENGYIKVDSNQRTSVSGVYAAGDATNSTDFKQIITSASQGAIATYEVYKELKS